MAEVDYQMALLLQYKFEQEHKNKENTESDQLLALELQQQFQAEADVEHPSNNLVYEAPTLNNSKCLVDPSWEVIDPTPDIHVLFMAFNQKFFWNTMGSVTVAWSKKMTMCAGVCSYQGRGGMCSITLSEPLLKLRPRKDLVETLLHEMIHAYLFVTNNNTDREGHGPEFHKHMYRINAEAGTNISVYHDFHDEVRLYQQHWWRCDGPCQNQKPFFGMIRRAINRAPGPNDRWWADHVRNCGGTFIKVKSPEKSDKPDPKNSNKKIGNTTSKPPDPKNDIRNYLPTSSKASVPISTESNKENKPFPNISSQPSTSQPKSTSTSSLINNIHTVSNSSGSNSHVSNVISSKTSNIFGLTNLNGSTSHTSGTSNSGTGVKGAVKNAGSSTFVVTKKGGETLNKTDESAIEKTSTSASNIEAFSGTGRNLSSSSCVSSTSNSDYSVVRDHWLKKFENSNRNIGAKNSVKRSNSDLASNSQKVPKFSDNAAPDKVKCPVCKKKFNMEELNSHLDSCLKSPALNTKQCFICSIDIPISSFERHVTLCSEKHFTDDLVDNDVFADLTQCSSCLKEFDQKSYARHNGHCIENNGIGLTRLDNAGKNKNCPVCKESLPPSKYDIHVEKCVLKMCEEFDKKYEESSDTKTPCLACNKEILKSELNSHLEECMSITSVLETSNFSEGEASNNENNSGGDKNDSNGYNCPFCLKLVLEKEMQNHLERCLNTEDCTNENVKEKSLLVESLCSTDSDME